MCYCRITGNETLMNDENVESHDRVRVYKALLAAYISKRPSGMKKKISEAIGTKSSFVSQITSPAYSVPVPSHYVHPIMDVCHLSPVERTEFLEAYVLAHPGQAVLLNQPEISGDDSYTVDLSAVKDEKTKVMIKHALKQLADTLIKISTANDGSPSE